MSRLLAVSGKMLCLCLLLASCGPAPTPTAAVAPTLAPLTATPAAAATSAAPAHKVQVTKDVEYAKLLEADAPAQTLDVYAPAGPGPWPVVVVIHAGFQTKDSARYTSLAKELAGRGAVVFVPQHRSLSATVLEAAQENGREFRELYETWACAVGLARESAAEYGGDPGQVAMFSDHGRGLEAAFLGDDLQPLWEQVASRAEEVRRRRSSVCLTGTRSTWTPLLNYLGTMRPWRFSRIRNPICGR